VWDSGQGHQRIIGLLHLNSLLFQPTLDRARVAGEYAKPALYLDEDLRLEIALRRMQRGGQRLAIVLARDRREIGLLSLQDILKVIFGEVSL
jgi:CBS domain containing-hemolysin-like protein